MDPLWLSRKAIRALIVANLAMGVGILVMLVVSFAAPEFLQEAIGISPLAADSRVWVGARAIMVIGLAGIPLNHLILARLGAIVGSVAAGPFISANAARLRSMGLALLGLELLHLGVGAVSALAFEPEELRGLRWSFSATRWLAVLMLFVLARVFDEGARMREDLEGTI